MKSRIPLFTVLGLLITVSASASAHPHVWVTTKSELVYAADGSLTGIRQHWTFDDMFSAFATEGLQGKEKGKLTRDDLAPLAKLNVESLKEYAYFTYGYADGHKVAMTDPPPGYWADFHNGILTLNFTISLKRPVKAKELHIEIYDPTFFIDFELAKSTPVELHNAPAGCKLSVERPKDMTTTQSLSLGEQFFMALNAKSSFGEPFANRIQVRCP